VLESSSIMVETVAGAAAGAIDTVVVADFAVDIAALSEAADILTEIDHGLACCLSLHTYHILLWV